MNNADRREHWKTKAIHLTPRNGSWNFNIVRMHYIETNKNIIIYAKSIDGTW